MIEVTKGAVQSMTTKNLHQVTEVLTTARRTGFYPPGEEVEDMESVRRLLVKVDMELRTRR